MWKDKKKLLEPFSRKSDNLYKNAIVSNISTILCTQVSSKVFVVYFLFIAQFSKSVNL